MVALGETGPERLREADEARWAGWMRRANAGDDDAYRELLRELGDAVEAYIRSRFGSGDFVEDCVQECLLAIHRARASYDPRRRFRPWLFTIVRHKAIDLLRRRGTRSRFEAPEQAGFDGPVSANRPDVALEAAQALDGLEPVHREALVLTKLQGYTLEEAARFVGVSASAMKSRVYRALRQVRARLDREED
jgi:RNA polymerase sigma-70 factor (ECF subfamily)